MSQNNQTTTSRAAFKQSDSPCLYSFGIFPLFLYAWVQVCVCIYPKAHTHPSLFLFRFFFFLFFLTPTHTFTSDISLLSTSKLCDIFISCFKKSKLNWNESNNNSKQKYEKYTLYLDRMCVYVCVFVYVLC